MLRRRAPSKINENASVVGQAKQKRDKLIPSIEKNNGDAEAALHHPKQNIDIHDVELVINPKIQAVVDKAKASQKQASVSDLGDDINDPSFLNTLQACVNRWTSDIQKVTKLDNESETFMQEVAFWHNLENALKKIEQQCESESVCLTLDILNHAKRFYAAVSFCGSVAALKEVRRLAGVHSGNDNVQSGEPVVKKPKVQEEPERVGYLYHFYDPIGKRFVNTGQSEICGSNMREANHVNDSTKPTPNTKLQEIHCLMSDGGTGLYVFRSKLQLTKDEAVNFEGCFLLADDEGANINAGSFRGEYATYSDDQKRAIGEQLIAEALECITDDMTLYHYSNFKDYKPINICRKGTCRGSCKQKDVDLWVAGYCRNCQTEYKNFICQIGKCEGRVEDENGSVLFNGCGKTKPIKNQSAKFCDSCNTTARWWKNRAVCQGSKGTGCTNSASPDKSAVVPITLLTPNKMCKACSMQYNRAKKSSKNK